MRGRPATLADQHHEDADQRTAGGVDPQGRPRKGPGPGRPQQGDPVPRRAPDRPARRDRREHPALGLGALRRYVQVDVRIDGLRGIRRPDRPVTGNRDGGPGHPYPSACSRSSSIPKWWAISCTTVTSVSATTLSRSSHIRKVGLR